MCIGGTFFYTSLRLGITGKCYTSDLTVLCNTSLPHRFWFYSLSAFHYLMINHFNIIINNVFFIGAGLKNARIIGGVTFIGVLVVVVIFIIAVLSTAALLKRYKNLNQRNRYKYICIPVK